MFSVLLPPLLLQLPPSASATGASSVSSSSEARPWRNLQSGGGAGYGKGSTEEPCSAAGAALTAASGSLDFFDGHADGDVCSWTITCPATGGTPVLVFTDFDTEANYDWVDVYSGSDATGGLSTRLAHLSGAGLSSIGSPGPYSAWTHTMYVRFSADQSIGGQGFVAQYNCHGGEGGAPILPPPTSPCVGGVTLTESEGTIDFFNGHDHNAQCTWTIRCPAGPAAGVAPTLSFTQFDTESGYDWVDVFDGDLTTGSSHRLAHLSGSDVPTGSFRSDQGGSVMTVRFTSDASVGRQGFAATYACQTTADMYTSIVESLLEIPACAAVREAVRGSSASEGCAASSATVALCPLPCAELWVAAADRIADPQASMAVEAAAPGVTSRCRDAATASLATAPQVVTVSGLGCNAPANAAYTLQPVPLNGRPHYATRDGGFHLYWTPRGGLSGANVWVIDSDTNDGDYETMLLSAADAPPTGSAVWSEWCDGSWTNARLQLAASRPDPTQCAVALQRLAPRLTATCCRPEDGPLCGESGAVPGACSEDCAHAWAPHVEQCPADQAFYGQPELTAFFGGEVRGAFFRCAFLLCHPVLAAVFRSSWLASFSRCRCFLSCQPFVLVHPLSSSALLARLPLLLRLSLLIVLFARAVSIYTFVRHCGGWCCIRFLLSIL